MVVVLGATGWLVVLWIVVRRRDTRGPGVSVGMKPATQVVVPVRRICENCGPGNTPMSIRGCGGGWRWRWW